MKKFEEDHRFAEELKKGLHEFSQPFICPSCGAEDCKKLRHILKLSTLPRWLLRPQRFVIIYAISIGIVWLLMAGYLYSLYVLGFTMVL